jgi:hypothetical protein
MLLQAANWFVQNKLQEVVGFVKARPGYELLLVGHSLGAGGFRNLVPGLYSKTWGFATGMAMPGIVARPPTACG